MKKHIMFVHVRKAIDHTVLLAFSHFWYTFSPLTDEYLPHTVLDCKVIGPQANITFYQKYVPVFVPKMCLVASETDQDFRNLFISATNNTCCLPGISLAETELQPEGISIPLLLDQMSQTEIGTSWCTTSAAVVATNLI